MPSAPTGLRRFYQPSGPRGVGILLYALVAAAQSQTPAREHQAVLDRVIKAYDAIQGYEFEAVITNQVTRQPRGMPAVKVSALGPERETLSVAYSAPNRLRLERADSPVVDIFRDAGHSFIMKSDGGAGYSPGNSTQDRSRFLAGAGLTDYTAIEDNLWEPRVLRDEDVTVDGVPVRCKVIQATYRVQVKRDWTDLNQPEFWVGRRIFWVDSARNAVLREVDLVHGLRSVDGADFEHTITLRKLVWNQRPPDSRFDVPTLSGTVTTRPKGLAPGLMQRGDPDERRIMVTPGPNGWVPAVPVVDGCEDVGPAAQLTCLLSAQHRTCQGLPVSQEVRIAHLSGSVGLAYSIDTEGKPADIRVTQSLGLGLDEQAADCLSHWRWRPAEKDGKPAAVKTALLSFGMGVASDSVWHLMQVEFHPANGASRPLFSKAGYPPMPSGPVMEQVTGFSVFHLRLTIDKSGIPRDIRVVPGVDPKLDREAIQIVSKWRFKPGREDGAPVEVPADFALGLGHDLRPRRVTPR
jgi:TonB family protein